MTNKQFELINELLREYEKEQNNSLQKDPTFFEILGRTYDEDLISRLVAYLLQKDEGLMGKILSFACGREISSCRLVNIECEKSMCGGRADIFAQAQDFDGNAYSLTIENKIFSWEHDDQTETYCKFVNSQTSYLGCENVFVYLKPDFNLSLPVCKQFKVLTYSCLLNMISATDDAIIADFARHIRNNLTSKEVKLMDTDTLVLKNYGLLKEIMSSAESKFEAIKQQVVVDLFSCGIEGLDYNPYENNDKVWDSIPAGNLVIEVANSTSCFRVYRKDKWRSGNVDLKDKFYFFVELKFNGNNPNDISVLNIIKRYGQKAQESIIHKFLSENNIYSEGGAWCVLSIKPIDLSGYEILSDEWKKALKTKAALVIKESLDEMDGIFEQFENWKSNI